MRPLAIFTILSTMPRDNEERGELYIFSSVALWSIFPIVTVLLYRSVPAIISLSVSSFFAALFFGVFIIGKKKLVELKDKNALRDILLMTACTGILYYILYFLGLKHTSPGNASIIGLVETFFSYIFFNIWRKEYFSLPHAVGAALMLIGALTVLYPGFNHFQSGDVLVLCAAAVGPLGNFFQRRARLRVSSEAIMFTRSLVAAPVIFFIAYMFGERTSVANLMSVVWLLLINGAVVLGISKIWWIEGIHRISVTKANALTAVSPFLTLVLAWLVLHQFPTIWQVLAIVPMSVGVVLLSARKEVML